MKGDAIDKKLEEFSHWRGINIPVRLLMPNYGIADESELADSGLLDGLIVDVFDNTIITTLDPLKRLKLDLYPSHISGEINYDLCYRTGMISVSDIFDEGKIYSSRRYVTGEGWGYYPPNQHDHWTAASNFAESHVYDLAAQMSEHF